MTFDDKMQQMRQEKNSETVKRLVRIQEDLEARSRTQLGILEKKANTTFRDLRVMIWVAYVMGLLLITTSVLLFIYQQKTLEVLGLGTLGVADWVSLFLYKPMDRLQKANADFSQQVLILESGTLSPNLELLAMNVTDPQTVITASKNIRSALIDMVRAIQEFIEG